MCTLTFIPQKDGFVFTHNRDESKHREPAYFPEKREIHGNQVLFPKDGRAGGTWIACSSELCICLLNGAFEKHAHQPPYSKSRGIVLLDVFTYDSLQDFSSNYNLLGVEPFTLVAYSTKQALLSELRWDGETKHFSILKNVPSIWSSATLYDTHAQQKRKEIFNIFIAANPSPTAPEIAHFHISAKSDQPHENLVMHRPNGVMTLSISQITGKEDTCFQHKDLVLNNTDTVCL